MIVSGRRDERHGVVIQRRGTLGPQQIVTFLPDGNHIVTDCSDNNICIWDAETGHVCFQTIRRHLRGSCIAISHDVKRIVFLDDNTIMFGMQRPET